MKQISYEKFDFMSNFGQYTNDFEKYIQWNWGFVSGNKLSRTISSFKWLNSLNIR
ncbi:MAG: hypothetical protein Q9M97_00865 [Candidatus Gracilibacteria bacterium]|nr:hypothetical protein [Candidatus Gracilibacteria bacterium]